MKKAYFIIIVLGLIISASAFYIEDIDSIEVKNAYVSGHILRVSAAHQGVLSDMLPDEGTFITKGSLLFRVNTITDDFNIDILKEELRSAINTEALNCAKQIVARAEVAQKEVELEYEKYDLKLNTDLFDRSVITKNKLVEKEHLVNAKESQLSTSKAELKYIEYANKTPLLKRPSVTYVKQKIHEALMRRELGVGMAPYDGYVYKLLAYPGQYVEPGDEILVFVPKNKMEFEVNVLETQLKFFSPGKQVEIIADVLEKEQVLYGSVKSIVPSISSAFSQYPRNNTDSNWIKVSQRVPVIISINDQASIEHWYDLPVGSSVSVKVAKEVRVGSIEIDKANDASAAEHALSEVTHANRLDHNEYLTELLAQMLSEIDAELLALCDGG